MEVTTLIVRPFIYFLFACLFLSLPGPQTPILPVSVLMSQYELLNLSELSFVQSCYP